MKDSKPKTIHILAIIIIAILICILILLGITKTKGISSVKRLLKEKYDNISCIDLKCEGIMAENNKDDKSKDVMLYNSDGKLIARYNQKNNKKTKTPFILKKEYFLATITDSNKNVKYTINSKNGKELYNTKNKLKSINDNFIIMSEEGRIGDVYTIIDKNGKTKFSNINEYKTYLNGKYIYFESNEGELIIDENGNKVLENYKIESEIKYNDKIEYVVLRDSKDNNYYYYNLKNKKIIGDGFNSYKLNSDNTLTITVKNNNKSIKYTIDEKGNRKEIKEESNSDTINKVKEKLDDSKYYLYASSIASPGQEKVLVDNKIDKSFGVLNIKTNEYEKLYSYNKDRFYSSIDLLDSTNNHSYIQISCSGIVSDKAVMLVYDITDYKELFRLEGTDLIAQNYVQYENNYKVVKYSHQSNNSDYKGKYALYDDKNNELLVSNNQISVIDSKYVMGKVEDKSLVLYNSKVKKTLNDDSSLAEKLDIKNLDYYKYKKDGKSIIIDLNGREIYSANNESSLEYDDKNIYELTSTAINTYNIKTKKVSTYKYKENENINDISNEKILPFENAIFINNNEDEYVKVINTNGKVIKQIKNIRIKSVVKNEDTKKAIIITRKKVDGSNKYGVYIAK